MEIKYITNGALNADKIMEVFYSVGWNKDKKNIIKAFEKSFYILAYYNDELIGFARAISDYEYYTGVYDVVIKPYYHGQGIGKKMMETIVKKFKNTYIFLTYTNGNREFYKKCGFIDNNNSMWIPKGSAD
jgi:GNAT superfamily N-acetyltransferase